MNSLQHNLKHFDGTLRWTPAHPEKRNSMSANCSRDSCLNHVADKITKCQVNFDIECQYELIELQVEDIMKDLIIPNSWRRQMENRTTNILAGIQQQMTHLQKETNTELS